MELAEVARLVGGEICGDPAVRIANLASIEAAGADDLTFLVKANETERLAKSAAGAALVPLAVNGKLPMPVIKVRDPYLASAIIHNMLLATPFQAKGIDARACVGCDCAISDEVTIGPLAVIGDRVRIGQRVIIGAGTVVGDDVVIGDDVELKANVTIYADCVLGDKVIIHSGAVIGSDGYGYATDGMGRHVKRPHVGRVRIDDDVEIGANVCVDRGAFGDTWIQSGVKIDNMVQVAHNVVIGPNSLIVAQVGISGSTVLGRNVVLGGQVGLAGHLHLEDQVMVAAGSGVHASLPKGAKVGGIPAFDVRAWAKSAAVYAKLPEMRSEMKRLQKKIAELEERLAESPITGETHE
jgi:UDP-3-O-[3-hydroxymyristoyl] glucosamine N-acyltransferase